MRVALKNLALKLVGCPYIWGGGNPWSGLDCSGFVIWIYQVFGLLPSGDWTAQLLYQHFAQRPRCAPGATIAGDVVFYGRDCESITHVMLSLGGGLVVGASGGGRACVNLAEAAKRGAMVKVKPWNYRLDLLACIQTMRGGMWDDAD